MFNIEIYNYRVVKRSLLKNKQKTRGVLIIMFLFFILLIIAALYFYQHSGLEGSGIILKNSDHALEILRQRYANGEISEQDFLDGKRILESH